MELGGSKDLPFLYLAIESLSDYLVNLSGCLYCLPDYLFGSFDVWTICPAGQMACLIF